MVGRVEAVAAIAEEAAAVADETGAADIGDELATIAEHQGLPAAGDRNAARRDIGGIRRQSPASERQAAFG